MTQKTLILNQWRVSCRREKEPSQNTHITVPDWCHIKPVNASTNAILKSCKLCFRDVKIILLYSMETFCLPVLSYSSEALNFSNKQIQLNVCWNSTFRKEISYMNFWNSVKNLYICVKDYFIDCMSSGS